MRRVRRRNTFSRKKKRQKTTVQTKKIVIRKKRKKHPHLPSDHSTEKSKRLKICGLAVIRVLPVQGLSQDSLPSFPKLMKAVSIYPSRAEPS